MYYGRQSWGNSLVLQSVGQEPRHLFDLGYVRATDEIQKLEGRQGGALPNQTLGQPPHRRNRIAAEDPLDSSDGERSDAAWAGTGEIRDSFKELT